FKIDVLSAMWFLTNAWDEVTQSTIANCWTHTHEDMDIDEDSPSLPSTLTIETQNLRAGWDVVLEFATTKMSLPQAEKRLKEILGAGYVASDWKPVLDVVMDAEEDSAVTEPAVHVLMPDFTKDSTATSSLPTPIANDRQLKEAESAFADALQTLRRERCLCGEDASIEELLNPQIEQEDLDSVFLQFAEGDE
ncbi:hypothetical protein K438DRAFT_1447001, partial [Mycena galopus ATCC 62051]